MTDSVNCLVTKICLQFFVEAGGEPGYKLLVNHLLPLLAKLVSDPQAEVRHAAGEGLVAVAELLRVEDQGQHILTIVLQLSHDDEQDELRMAAVSANTKNPPACGIDELMPADD